MEDMINVQVRGEELKEQGWIFGQKQVRIEGEKFGRSSTEVVVEKGRKVFMDQGARLTTG